MKTSITIAAFALFTFQSFAADATTELAAAKARHEAAVAAATKPLNERYMQELQQLKSRAMLNKNLDLAVAVDAELKTMLPAAAAPAHAPEAIADVGTSKAKLKAILPTLRLDGTWSYGEFLLVFSDTEATLMPNTKFVRTCPYEVIAARKVRVTLPARPTVPNDRDTIIEIEFSKDMTQFTSNRTDLKGKVSPVAKK